MPRRPTRLPGASRRFSSASATVADRHEATAAGADAYLAKPATASDIMAVLRQRT